MRMCSPLLTPSSVTTLGCTALSRRSSLHLAVARTSAITRDFLDPAAAFTLEYVDLHLNSERLPSSHRSHRRPQAFASHSCSRRSVVRHNLTQLYVPSARAEFRLWEFGKAPPPGFPELVVCSPTQNVNLGETVLCRVAGWQDVPYFVRRRSEERARETKRHLERSADVLSICLPCSAARFG